jgi:hypothetical protein
MGPFAPRKIEKAGPYESDRGRCRLGHGGTTVVAPQAT